MIKLLAIVKATLGGGDPSSAEPRVKGHAMQTSAEATELDRIESMGSQGVVVRPFGRHLVR